MATKSVPLALPSTAYGEGSGWRRGEHLIDALPYIDGLSPEIKQQVDALIEEEMKRSTKRPADYLKELGPVPGPKFESNPLLAAEYERVKSGQPMTPLDTSRYRLDPPGPTKRNDFNAWKSALDNAHSQLEHQYLRILNLELLLKYGDKSWRAQAQSGEALLKSLESEVAALTKAKNELNQTRKLSQSLAGNELAKAHDEYYGLVRKNFEIEKACEALEARLAELRPPPQQQQQQEQTGAAANGGAGDESAHAEQQQQQDGSLSTDVEMNGAES